MSDVEKRKIPELRAILSRNVSDQAMNFRKETEDSLDSSNTGLEIVNESQTGSSTTTGTESESQRKSSTRDETEKTSVTETVESRRTQKSAKAFEGELMTASNSTLVNETIALIVGQSYSVAPSRKESAASHKSAIDVEKVSPAPSSHHTPNGSQNPLCSKTESLEESQKAKGSEDNIAVGENTDHENELVRPSSVGNTEELKDDSEQKPRLKKILLLPNETCDAFLKRKLGPGVYNLMLNGPVVKVLEDRPPKTGWARQMELERLAALPHLLYKEQWEENKMLKKKLGPGSYNIKDFIQLSNEKPRSGRGILDNLAPRFESKLLSATPGPGTYGINGVPQKSLEIKDNKSTSTKGLLDAGDRKRSLPSVGSHLGPGTYNHKPCTEQLLNKVTSLKGPYNLFTGERDDPIIAGYLAAPKLANLGPGQYEVKSFIDDLNTEHKKGCGRFGKASQYPDLHTDPMDFPGPGTYDPKLPKCCSCRDSTQENLQKCAKGTENLPGFLSSAKRDDKVSQKFFIGNYNPVGAGRYDIQKFEEAADVNGHTSVFKSKTGRPNFQVSKFLQERLRGKDLCPEDKICVDRVKRSITAM
ncbi:unnamed protein product [Lymnaea stagnalis]|uniref:Uncharacterized protein n=1 Tax=Lymnaea stagnalis TaxID=6523 RepID=A0AAV2HCF6_LYMST